MGVKVGVRDGCRVGFIGWVTLRVTMPGTVINSFRRLEEKLESDNVRRLLSKIFLVADILRVKPATALIRFISLCLDDQECTVNLSTLISKHSNLLLKMFEERKSMRSLIQLVQTIIAESNLAKINVDTEKEYERLRKLLGEDNE